MGIPFSPECRSDWVSLWENNRPYIPAGHVSQTTCAAAAKCEFLPGTPISGTALSKGNTCAWGMFASQVLDDPSPRPVPVTAGGARPGREPPRPVAAALRQDALPLSLSLYAGSLLAACSFPDRRRLAQHQLGTGGMPTTWQRTGNSPSQRRKALPGAEAHCGAGGSACKRWQPLRTVRLNALARCWSGRSDRLIDSTSITAREKKTGWREIDQELDPPG